MNTQNGWSIIQASDNTLDRSNIPGTNVQPAPGLRKGDVAVVLHEVGRLFDQNVQKLVQGWSWGWAQPQVLPGGTYSNHGSGTAIDLNAPNFPMGLSRMSSKQIAACRNIVKEMDGVVRWGGEYPGSNIDQMHFEIIGNASQVKQLADKIKSGGNMSSKSNLATARQLDYAILGRDGRDGRPNAYTGNSDADIKKNKRDSMELSVKNINSLFDSKEARAYRDSVTKAYNERNELRKRVKELESQLSDSDAQKKLDEVRKIVN